jgi:hypothetical protein
MKNDGKYLEDALDIELAKAEIALDNFKYRRLPDSRAARGLIAAQPSDFFVSHRYSGAAHIECKSSKSKTLRLPKFVQHAEMLGWANAGVAGIVLVHFYVPDRLFLVDVTTMPIGKPSWVLGDDTGTEIKGIEDVVVSILTILKRRNAIENTNIE